MATIKDKICLSCLKPLSISPIRTIIEKEPFICDSCLKSIDYALYKKRILNVEFFFLYRYSNITKRWLINFKEKRDVALAPAFLFTTHTLVKLYCFNKSILTIPSTNKNMERRGFNHLKLILDAYNINSYSYLKKSGEEEQKNADLLARKSLQNIFSDNISFLKNKDIVLFDDVLTTGTTIKSTLNYLKDKVKSVKVLIMMDNFSNVNNII